MIDDDGVTTDYLQGKYSVTTCAYTFSDPAFHVMLNQTGDFDGRPSRATVRLSFPQMPMLSLISPKGVLPVTSFYSHEILGTVLTFKDVDLRAGLSVELTIHDAYPLEVLPNFVGALGRIRRARYAKDAMDVFNVPYGDQRAKLTAYALAATWMSPTFAASLPELWQNATSQVAGILKSGALKNDPRRSKFLNEMLDLDPTETMMSSSALLI